MKTSVLCILVVLTLLELQMDSVESQCCNSHRGRCGDGTRSTPCCGYRRCNFFCCACGGGCRRGKRQAEDDDAPGEDSDEVTTDDDPFVKYDTDEDGKISLNEASSWLIAGGCGNPFVKIMALSKGFQELDNDNDGGLDRQEIGG